MKACDGLGAEAQVRYTPESLVVVIAIITTGAVQAGKRFEVTWGHRLQNLKGTNDEHRAQLKSPR